MTNSLGEDKHPPSMQMDKKEAVSIYLPSATSPKDTLGTATPPSFKGKGVSWGEPLKGEQGRGLD